MNRAFTAISMLLLTEHYQEFRSLGGGGEFDQKLRAARMVLFGADASAVLENDLLHDREA